MDHIIIPTVGRMHNQVTLKNLPGFLLDITTLVVQPHEETLAKKLHNNVLVLPKEIQTLSPTKEWISKRFKNKTYFILDDDLEFFVKDYDKSKVIQVRDFFNLIEEIDLFEVEGIYWGGLNPSPNVSLSYSDPKGWIHNFRVMTNMWVVGPKIPQIDWNRVVCAQDYDIALQLLSKGYENRVSTKYFVRNVGEKGGCNLYRTNELRLESYKKLRSFFPDLVRVRERNDRPYVDIYWKKALSYNNVSIES
jgi:hypothetical protein